MVDLVRERMTADEFFALPETNTPEELLDGVYIVSPAPVPEHQETSGNLYVYVRSLIPDGKLYPAPISVYFDVDNVPEPDLVWVSQANKHIVKAKRIEGTPDLIIEIASPGTVSRDRREKFYLYEKYGVREYWMVDSLEKFIEVYFHENGRFQRQGVYIEGETFESKALGKAVEIKDIFPKETDAE